MHNDELPTVRPYGALVARGSVEASLHKGVVAVAFSDNRYASMYFSVKDLANIVDCLVALQNSGVIKEMSNVQ